MATDTGPDVAPPAGDATPPKRRRSRSRSALVAALVFLSCAALLLAVVGIWAKRNVLDTDRFVQRVETFANDPAVEEALSIALTNQLMRLIDPEALFEEALPDRGQILAAPLANAVEGFVRDQVETFVASDPFEEVLVRVVARAHSLAVRLLQGDGDVLDQLPDGTVTLNLLPVVEDILARISAASPEIFGREIDIPEITVDDLPAEAVARLENAFDIDLGDRFGQITVYDTSRLEAIQDAVDLIENIVVLSVICAIGFAAAALVVSHRRRRTLLQLLFGWAIVLVILRRLLYRVAEDVQALAQVEVNGAAARAIVEAFTGPLLTATAVMLVLFAIAAAVALVTGDYAWAVSLRRQFGLAAGAARDRATDDATTTWVRGHREALQVGAAVVGVLLLWVLDLSWFGVLLLLVLVGGFALLVQRLGAEPEEGAPAPPV